MPSTHTSLHYHLVWSTKDRRNLIESTWKPRLHQWLGGCIKALEGVPLAIGGVADHVHCLVGLKATHCLADFMRVLKSESSEWARKEIRKSIFQWQEGYGAFHGQSRYAQASRELHPQPGPAPQVEIV